MPITTCVFDAYGTLFDVTAAARESAQQPGREALKAVWQKLAADWRAKQLEYSWLRAVTGHHCSFWQVTEDGLDWAMEANGLDDPLFREELLALYWELDAYPEVPAMLAALKSKGLNTAILSNGSTEMLEGAVDRAELSPLLDHVLSVDQVGVFKPDRRVYELVGKTFGCDREDVLFVSSNGWDVASAADFGFRTVWVNRTGAPMDRLYGQPDTVLPDLTTIMDNT